MWNSNNIIRFEFGAGIIKAANSPDTRHLFLKMFGSAPNDDAKLIIEGIGHIRKHLANYGIVLPSIYLTDNNNIKDNEFICYWGIEQGHYSITLLSDIFDFIKNKAIEYAKQENTPSTFAKALGFMEKDKYQLAYDTYKKLYYKARLEDDFYVSTRALTEVSSIIAYNDQIDFAIQLASVAVQYVDSYNIVDQTLKCQVYLNMASICKSYNTGMSMAYFMKCTQIAYKSDNSQFLFFSLLGLAEIYTMMGHFHEAIEEYEKALNLVGDSGVAVLIQKKMISLYKYLVTQGNSTSNKENIKSQFYDLLKYIVKEVGASLCKAALFKILNIQGMGAMISVGTKYQIENNIFKSSAVIGNNNNLFKK